MISISDNQIVTSIGRFATLSTHALLEASVGLGDASVDTVSGMAGIINDYGITVVLSAVLIIFAVVMFNMIVKRSVNSEQILMKETQEIVKRLDKVETILGHESSSSEVFDRLNGKITQGIDELGRELSDIKHSMEKIQDTLDELKKIRM